MPPLAPPSAPPPEQPPPLTPAIKGSLGWHALSVGGVLAAPELWPWWLGSVAANHALLAGWGLMPRSRVLGPNLSRLPERCRGRAEIALTIDDGPDPEVTPAMLRQLADAGVRATFFCIGQRVRAFPDLARAITQAGHGIENHSEHHAHHFSLLGRSGFRREIESAQESIATVTGVRPRYFRAPAGLRNPMLEPALQQLGLRLVSWTRRGLDTVTRDPDRVARRLLRNLGAGDILLLHDGHSARDRQGRPVVLSVLPAVLAEIRAGALVPVTIAEAFG